MRIAINGFGRIGKSFLRALLNDPAKSEGIEVVAINGGNWQVALAESIIRYDTVMGKYAGSIVHENNTLRIGPYTIVLLSETDGNALDWGQYDIDWVVDCSGHYTTADTARQHITHGARNVLISAPAHGTEGTIILGVNEKNYVFGSSAQNHIVSLGSCTTNALLPVIKVLQEHAGVDCLSMLTAHSYTNSQSLLDSNACEKDRDVRRCRAAALNIIPSTTGAEGLVKEIFPELAGCVTALSIRVPVADVSLLSVQAILKTATTIDELRDAFKRAAQRELAGIMAVTNDQLVSSDFLGDPHSAIIDLPLLSLVGNLVSVYGWYDNEWGYSCRIRDFLMLQQGD